MKPKSGFWRNNMFGGFVVVVFMWTTMMVYAAENKTTVVVNVGVVFDLSSLVGKMILSCIDMSFSDFYVSHPHHNTTIVLHLKDSKGDVVEAATQAMELIKKRKVEVVILGAESWWEAYFIMKLGEKLDEVPIISFATPSSSFSSTTFSYHESPYFFRVAQNPSSQVQAITDMVTNFRWRQVVAIYQDGEFGKWFVADLMEALQDAHVRVHRSSLIDATATGDQIIRKELYRLRKMQTRVFVVHMIHSLATRVFAVADELGMMSQGYVWILTDATASNAMQGVLGLKTYVPRTRELENFILRWRRKLRQDNPEIDDPKIDIYGLWAYDAAWAVAMAVETSIIGTEDEIIGKRIRDSFSKTKLKGISGEFSMVKGQLDSPILEIVNAIGDGETTTMATVGYWTRKMGLASDLKGKKSGLRSIIWPGDSISVPKGWEVSFDGEKTMKIGVPSNVAVREFTQVTNGSIVGYCIDIFEAVVKELPYALSYEFIHFNDTRGRSSASYDDLIVQVFQQKYDAAVGDLTILANRSLWVDFTLPFTEDGISVVIPVRRNLRNHEWVFLKPLTLKLWITSLCFFVFMGFVVWILEHQNNENFRRGPPSHRIGTTLWFSFCTIVFAQWDTLMSNLARFVVVIWFFVVFILTQSYTASLTSWLTMQQLQPITDINQIIKNDWSVGYQEGSYLLNTLAFLGIKNLVPYGSLDHLHELFTKGSCNGGVDAAIDEIPYMKLFLSRHYGDYAVVDSLFKSNGFGFAFPLGSFIVEDMSKAVLKVTESDKMGKIQDKWFGKKIGRETCSSSGSLESSSSSLDLSYFKSLFLIAASAAIFALLLYFLLFLHNHVHSDSTTWTTIVAISRLKIGRKDTRITAKPPEAVAVAMTEVSLTTNAPPSSPSNEAAQFVDPSHGNQKHP